MTLKDVSIIVGLIYGTLVPTGVWLEHRWNQTAEVREVWFCAHSNKEMYLETKLAEICYKYNMVYPCDTGVMSPQDRALYQQYQSWLREVKEDIKRSFKRK